MGSKTPPLPLLGLLFALFIELLWGGDVFPPLLLFVWSLGPSSLPSLYLVLGGGIVPPPVCCLLLFLCALVVVSCGCSFGGFGGGLGAHTLYGLRNFGFFSWDGGVVNRFDVLPWGCVSNVSDSKFQGVCKPNLCVPFWCSLSCIVGHGL